MTYGKLFSGNPNPANTNTGNGTGYSVATNGRNYTVNEGILMTDALRPQLQTLADRYAEQTGGNLRITSGYRPPSRQASAMYDLIQNKGTTYVRNLYANKGAVNEILTAYANGGQASMTRAIEGQVDRGVYISSHLRSRALDTGTDANFGVLQNIVRDMGGTVANEGNHFHIQF